MRIILYFFSRHIDSMSLFLVQMDEDSSRPDMSLLKEFHQKNIKHFSHAYSLYSRAMVKNKNTKKYKVKDVQSIIIELKKIHALFTRLIADFKPSADAWIEHALDVQ